KSAAATAETTGTSASGTERARPIRGGRKGRLARRTLCFVRGLTPYLSALSPRVRSGRRRGRRLDAQIPARHVNPGRFQILERCARNLPHVLPDGIGDFQRHVVDRLVVDPRDHGRAGRVLAVERLIAPELVIAVARRPPI